MAAPKFISKGDYIGIVAPASPPHDESVIERCKDFLERKGLQVILGKKVYKKNGFLAGTDQERAKDFTDIYLNKKVKAIFSLRGGYGSVRIAPLIPWKRIFSSPKPFIGFSDVTTFHSIFSKGKVISYHGPVLTQILRQEGRVQDAMWESLYSKLSRSFSGENVFSDTSDMKVIVKGKAEGKLVGGNLCTLVSLLGTKYEPYYAGSVLFLEDIGEEPYKVDRFFTQLILSGRLNKVKAILLGSFTDCDPKVKSNIFRQNVTDVIKERLGNLKIPVISGLPFGHGDINETLPVGAVVTIEAKTSNVEIKFK